MALFLGIVALLSDYNLFSQDRQIESISNLESDEIKRLKLNPSLILPSSKHDVVAFSRNLEK